MGTNDLTFIQATYNNINKDTFSDISYITDNVGGIPLFKNDQVLDGTQGQFIYFDKITDYTQADGTTQYFNSGEFNLFKYLFPKLSYDILKGELLLIKKIYLFNNSPYLYLNTQIRLKQVPFIPIHIQIENGFQGDIKNNSVSQTYNYSQSELQLPSKLDASILNQTYNTSEYTQEYTLNNFDETILLDLPNTTTPTKWQQKDFPITLPKRDLIYDGNSYNNSYILPYEIIGVYLKFYLDNSILEQNTYEDSANFTVSVNQSTLTEQS